MVMVDEQKRFKNIFSVYPWKSCEHELNLFLSFLCRVTEIHLKMYVEVNKKQAKQS